MMMMLVILAVIGGVAAGVPTVPGCYTPHQWEGVMISMIGRVQGGIPRVTNVLTLISYDEKNNTIAYNISSSVNGNTQYTRRILDYNQGKQYVIDLNIQSCDIVDLPGKFKKFQIPSNLKPKGKFYYGVGKQTVPAVAFGLNLGSSNMTIVMTADNCLPIGETIVEVSGSDADMQTFSYIDLTLGIKDKAVFRPPVYCTPGTYVKSKVKENVHPELKSYSVFNVL